MLYYNLDLNNQLSYFKASKNIKIGISCSIVIPAIHTKTNNTNGRHWCCFFIIYTILVFQKKSKLVSSVRL
jgi:hypothetical protein